MNTRSCLITSTDMLRSAPKYHLQVSSRAQRAFCASVDFAGRRICFSPLHKGPFPDSSCQTSTSLVNYSLGTSVVDSLISRQRILPTQENLKSAPSLCNATLLESTLLQCLASVDSKELAEFLSPLDPTLTKNRGEGCPPWPHASACPPPKVRSHRSVNAH